MLTDPALRAAWEADVNAMRERIAAMRRSLHGVLQAKRPGRDFGYFLTGGAGRLTPYSGRLRQQQGRLLQKR